MFVSLVHYRFKKGNTRKADHPTSFPGHFLVLLHSVTNFTWIYLHEILLSHVIIQKLGPLNK